MSCEEEAHEHHHGHDHNHEHGAPPIPTTESQSLYAHILTNDIAAFNVSNPSDQLKHVVKDHQHKYSTTPLFTSDADCQLILKIPFEGSVKVYSVILRTSSVPDHCPRKVKFYTRELDFDSIEGARPTYEVEHPEVGIDDSQPVGDELVEETSFVEHYLPRHQFAGVTVLTIFVENNWGDEDEPTHLYSVEVRGEFQGLRKNPVVTIYESAANPADHKTVGVGHFQMQDAASSMEDR